MMEDEKLQLLIELFGELKKSEMSSVKNNIENSISDNISAVKNDIENSISAVRDEVSAVKNELRREISDFQERIRNIEAGQAEFEERVTRNLREDLSRNIEATRQDVEAMRRNLEATQRDLGTQLSALQVQTIRAGGSSAGTNADKVKPPKFDRSTSWVVFQRQFDAVAIHNDWTPREKAAHLLTVLHGQAAHVLHSVPAEASYENVTTGRFYEIQ
jgi:archaellum component FlaC